MFTQICLHNYYVHMITRVYVSYRQEMVKYHKSKTKFVYFLIFSNWVSRIIKCNFIIVYFQKLSLEKSKNYF